LVYTLLDKVYTMVYNIYIEQGIKQQEKIKMKDNLTEIINKLDKALLILESIEPDFTDRSLYDIDDMLLRGTSLVSSANRKFKAKLREAQQAGPQ